MVVDPQPSFTPRSDQMSSPSSITPTRHAMHQNSMFDFTSPSAYLNHDAYTHTGPNTPHGSLHDMTYDMNGTASGIPASVDENFAFRYGDFSAESGFMGTGPVDHSTPSASMLEDDSTPIIPDTQRPIQPSSLPCPPNIHDDDTIRASSQRHRPLMSPFRSFNDPPDMTTYRGELEQKQYIDPSTAFYPPSYVPSSYMYSGVSPQDPNGYATMPQYVNMQPLCGEQNYQPLYHSQVQPYGFPGPTRSRDPSPTGSAASPTASIARSGSTSSELRQVRPKVKLTFDDKRNIVELHRANSSLRQEDIARQYGWATKHSIWRS